jgi:hypothetical protein
VGSLPGSTKKKQLGLLLPINGKIKMFHTHSQIHQYILTYIYIFIYILISEPAPPSRG